MEVVYFIVLVGVLIFVHELGHFVWAKFFGVKVLKFSLGFGPTIAGFRRGETEYVVAALPLGGYVRMLGENPNDVISEQFGIRVAMDRKFEMFMAGTTIDYLDGSDRRGFKFDNPNAQSTCGCGKSFSV